MTDGRTDLDGRTWTDGHGRTDMDERTDLKDTQIPGSLQLQWSWEEEDSWSAWRCQSVATATVKMILVVIIENLRAFISYYYPFDRLNWRSHKANNDWCWVMKFYFELRHLWGLHYKEAFAHRFFSFSKHVLTPRPPALFGKSKKYPQQYKIHCK